MSATVKQIADAISALIPPCAAEDWDNVGLQVGSPEAVVDKVLVCLEVNQAVVDQAIAERCQLIVAHHPLIFKPLKSLATDRPKARLVSNLIKADIALYAMHTNYDHYEFGMSHLLAEALQLSQIEPLVSVKPQKLYKYVVYIPQAHYQAVAEAAFQAGAGKLNNYAECSFSVQGEGTFKPLVGAEPTIGQLNCRQTVAEVRFETLLQAGDLKRVVSAVERAHPYEVVAYDLIELDQRHHPFALGKRGRLAAALTADQFASHLKRSLGLMTVRLAGNLDRRVETIAVIGGAGFDYIDAVAASGVDAFVTGDVKYHEVVESRHHGLLIADVGHFESEIVFASGFADQLRTLLADCAHDVVVMAATVERPVFNYY